jgi:hypothetical protein
MTDRDSKKRCEIPTGDALTSIHSSDDPKPARGITRREFIKYSALTAAGIYLSTLTAGCGSGSQMTGDTSALKATDYSHIEHWLSLPSSPDNDVDVFYVYPTAYRKVAPGAPNFCTVDNSTMMLGA